MNSRKLIPLTGIVLAPFLGILATLKPSTNILYLNPAIM